MEVRVKGNKFYFIDATCRMGLPSTASQLELWRNWPEIVWHGANGDLVQPIPTAKFSAEAIITFKGEPDEWRCGVFPKQLQEWCKLADCCFYEGMVVFPASDSPNPGAEVGWLVAIGDTVEEAVRKVLKQSDMLPDGCDANVEHLGYVLKEIELEQKQGIRFGNGVIPKPGIVLTI
jgi:hypothetical protein